MDQRGGYGMNRSEILDTAKEYVTKDRASTHGDAEANFGLIAAYWSAHLNKNIKSHDVAVMMTLLKLARAKSNPAHADNWIDGCGYLACGGEIADKENDIHAKMLSAVRGEAL
jgi:hypothetical protein